MTRLALTILIFSFCYFLIERPVLAQTSGSENTTNPVKYIFPKFSHEPNPIVLQKPNGQRFTFLRTGKSTCGKYVVALVDVPAGGGPPPHIHYGSEEWFYPVETDMTVFTQKEDRIFKPGQLPGENEPAITLETTILAAGQLGYGPMGMVHAFKNETNKISHGFINLWSPGYGMIEFFRDLEQSSANVKMQSDLDELLIRISAKWGVPHDPRKVFVKDIAKPASPDHPHDNHSQRLEELIRSTESCNEANR